MVPSKYSNDGVPSKYSNDGVPSKYSNDCSTIKEQQWYKHTKQTSHRK